MAKKGTWLNELNGYISYMGSWQWAVGSGHRVHESSLKKYCKMVQNGAKRCNGVRKEQVKDKTEEIQGFMQLHASHLTYLTCHPPFNCIDAADERRTRKDASQVFTLLSFAGRLHDNAL